jgi:hypothetical protein
MTATIEPAQVIASPDELRYGLAEGNYLRPNGLGGYIISASAIGSWSYCQLRRFYELRARNDPDAPKGSQLSATAYGSVMHAAIMQMELAMFEGREGPLDIAIRFFDHYWLPDNIAAICPPIDEWLPRDTWNGLKDRAHFVLRTHYEFIAQEKETYLLALEHQFAVPFEVRGRVHTLTGAIDRLLIRRHQRKPYIGVDDLKTGRRPYYLRYNTQGGFYCYATSKREFWEGWPESGLGEMQAFPEAPMASMLERFASYGFKVHDGQDDPNLTLAARRFRWLDLKDNKAADGGWRVPQDYARLALAVDAYVRASEAEIYSVNAEGEKCRYCPFRKVCGGVGLPPDSVGAP